MVWSQDIFNVIYFLVLKICYLPMRIINNNNYRSGCDKGKRCCAVLTSATCHHDGTTSLRVLVVETEGNGTCEGFRCWEPV